MVDGVTPIVPNDQSSHRLFTRPIKLPVNGRRQQYVNLIHRLFNLVFGGDWRHAVVSAVTDRANGVTGLRPALVGNAGLGRQGGLTKPGAVMASATSAP